MLAAGEILLQMKMALSFLSLSMANVWTSYSSHYSFLLEPIMLMLQNALASVCDCTEVVGFLGSKWNAVVFYCDHVEHQQSVIAQQSAAINWMRICIQSRSFT